MELGKLGNGVASGSVSSVYLVVEILDFWRVGEYVGLRCERLTPVW